MKKWFVSLIALAAAAAVSIAALSVSVMAGKDDQPAVLTMTAGEAADFAPVEIRALLSDTDYDCTSWWEQTLTFDETGVRTDSRFHSGLERSREADFWTSTYSGSLQSDPYTDILLEGFDSLPDGRNYVRDYLDCYSYYVNLPQSFGFLQMEFPWLWSEVGPEDSIYVEESGRAVSMSGSISPLSAELSAIQLEDGWYFTLSNSFHGSRWADPKTGEEGELIRYGGSSGIFRVPLDENGEPALNDETGMVKPEQLFELPISSEGDTIVLRLDWLEQPGLFSLLASEGRELTLRLYDPVTGSVTDPLSLGESLLCEDRIVTTYEENIAVSQSGVPDACRVWVQGNLLLILQGDSAEASRAIVLRISEDGRTELLLDTSFSAELTSGDRLDDWMLWQDGILYFIEASDWWGASIHLYAVDTDGLRALGCLQNAGGRKEQEAGRYNWQYEQGSSRVPYPDYRGFQQVQLLPAGGEE